MSAADTRAIQAEAFLRFLAVMLPDGGWIVPLIETYLDESGSHAGALVLCVAGYIIEKGQAVELDREWREVLSSKDLPYFHMVDCAHRSGIFANLSVRECTYIEAQMIGIIKRRTIQGVAATVLRSEFDAIVHSHPIYRDPYVMVAHSVLQGLTKWIEANDAQTESMAYFFEAGHESRRQFEAIMNSLFGSQKLKDQYRYSGHAFVLKEKTPAVQAADLLAWQWAKDRKSVFDNRPRRKDCASLLEHPHNVAHIDAPLLERFAEHGRSISAASLGALRTLFS